MSAPTDGIRARLRALVATTFLVGALIAPIAALVTAGPAAACGVECSGTLTASTSNARVGDQAHITLNSGAGEDQCFELTASPSDGATLGGDGTPAAAATPSSGVLSWPVGSAVTGTVTYTVFYRGPTSNGADNICPDASKNLDPDAPLQSTAQITWLQVDGEQNSTLTASPNIVLADGQSASTVTVVLTSFAGNAITGQSVRLTGLPSSVQVSPATATSGTGGQAVFTVTSATAVANPYKVGAERLTSSPFGSSWTAIDAHDSLSFVTLDHAELALSSVSASLLRVPADGLSTTTITATLKDSSGPLSGRPVQLATDVAGPTVTPLASQTNSTGQISFVVSSSSAHSVVFTATDTSNGFKVGAVTVRFGQAPSFEQGKDTSALSLAPSQDVVTTAILPNDGTTAAAVYVQLQCSDTPSHGCNAAGIRMYNPNMNASTGTISGAQVALVPTGSTSALVSQFLNPTNYNGEARFQVTDTVPEDVTFNAFDVTNNVELASVDDSTSPPQVTPLKVTISFRGPGTPSATISTATAAPTSVAADGATASTITVTLKDANHLVVANKTLTLNPGGSATFTPAQVITDPNGVGTFSTVDKHAETVSYMVQDVSDNIALTTFPQVTFTAGAASAATSAVSASPTTLAANGTSTSTVTVTITDANGGPVSGKTVSLDQGGGHSTITGPTGATNANGVTTFTVKDGTPEAVTYKATDVTDGFDLTHTATVTFTGNPTSANSTVTADPASVPANSIATSNVTVTLKDQNGNPVAGKQVTLRKVSGQVAINPVTPGSDVSNQSGVAAFSLTDGTAETVTISAFDATDNIALSGTTKISFTGPPSGSTSTVTAKPTAVAADGTSTATITATVLDGSGQAIPGQNVTLAGNSGTHSNITSVTNPTNGAGQATFTVTDATAEAVTYSATDVSVNPNQKIFATATVTFGATPAISSISPNNGPSTGGTKVTISGTSLASASGVMFGSSAATALSVNKKNGSLTVTSPPGSGTVDVRVTFTGGGMTPAVAADKYSYAPQVTGISPTSGTHNGGTKVTISGTNFTGVPATGAVKFGTASATYTVNKNGTITATSPPGTAGTSVDVTVASPGGTSASSPADKFTYN